MYNLSDGQAVYVTDSYREVPHEHPGLYVSASGQVFNWGNRFLATYIGGKWKRIEALLSLLGTLVFDTGDKVYFYHNQNLYWVDKHGDFGHLEISSPIKSVPGQRGVHGALWGKNMMVILDYGYQHVYVYHLETGEPADVEKINGYLADRPVYDIFRAGDGAVWLLTWSDKLRSYIFLRVTPEGEIAPVKETASLGWNNTRCSQFRHSVLNASDGSIWFGTPRAGAARYKDGKIEWFGWKQGIGTAEVRYLFEDSRGGIYAGSPTGVYVYRQAQAPAEPPSWVNQWEEYRLTACHPIRDSNGNIWMFLEDHPGAISRWDGNQWGHMDFRFDIAAIVRGMSDDQGHILLQSSVFKGGAYDIGPGGIERYDWIEQMLTAAVKRGAKRFRPDSSFQGCVLLDEGRIWFGSRGSSSVYYYDGKRWDTFNMREGIHYLHESPKYGVLIHTSGGKYYTYDRGQLSEIPLSLNQPGRWLLGSQSLQPFEDELLKAYPREYVPVERAGENKLYLLVPRWGDTALRSRPQDYVRGDPLPQYYDTLTPGFSHGFWTDYVAGPIFRFFGGRVIQCDFRHTPLAGQEYEIRQVLEDRAHNLWFDAGQYAGTRHVFMKGTAGFKLKARDVPTEVKRSLVVRPEVLVGQEPRPDTRLFWRFEDGSWQEGEGGNPITIHFPGEGRYQIEVVAMGPLGEITPEPLSFMVNASCPLPHTLLTREGPYEVEDVFWEIPAKVVPSEADAIARLAYRIAGGEWQLAYEGNMLSFGELKAGKYRVEVAACEDERYYDATPLQLDVAYSPNYEQVLERCLGTIAEHLPSESRYLRLLRGLAENEPDSLRRDDSGPVKTALSQLRSAGAGIIPALEKRLAQAEKELRVFLIVHRMLRELKRTESNP